ncbi:MAG: outer membrane protein assembly factor BamD [Gammaproteobacteria bacterium]
MMIARLLILLTVILYTGGCSWLGEKEDETKDWSASRFFSEAEQEMVSANYTEAVRLFEKLQARYPFGRYAQQAQLEIAYAHYKNDEADQAIAAADRFIRTYPRHPFVDYAYYINGLANYSRGVGILEKLMPSDPTRTDTRTALRSFNDFAELVQKFPDSKYAEDARQRMLFLRNNLAEYEVNVGSFYLERKAYIAAANRGKYVVENFSRTPAVERALALMAEAYIELGMQDLAQDSQRILAVNYPDSPYLVRLEALRKGEKAPVIDEKPSMTSLLWDLL